MSSRGIPWAEIGETTYVEFFEKDVDSPFGDFKTIPAPSAQINARE